MTVNRLWQVWAAKAWGRDGYRALCERGFYRQLSRAAALSYFTVALTCIWIQPTLAGPFFTQTGLALAGSAFGVLLVLGTLVGAAVDVLVAGWRIAAQKLERGLAGTILLLLSTVMVVFAVSALVTALVLAPSIVGSGVKVSLVIKTVLVTAVMATLAVAAGGVFDAPMDRCLVRVSAPGRIHEVTAAWMGLRLFFLLTLLFQFAGSTPQFVYQEF